MFPVYPSAEFNFVEGGGQGSQVCCGDSSIYHLESYAYRRPLCTRDSDAHELVSGAAPLGIETSIGGPVAAICDAVVRPRSSWVECSKSSLRIITSSARTA